MMVSRTDSRDPATAWGALAISLGLLTKRDQLLLILVVMAQFLISLLDLAAILLIGLVGAIALTGLSSTDSTGLLGEVSDFLGSRGMDPATAAAPLAGLAAVLLIGKTLLSAWLTRRTLRFLSHRQATASAALARDLLNSTLLQVQARSTQLHAYALTSGVQAALAGIVGSTVTMASEIALLAVVGFGLLAIDPLMTLFASVFFGAVAVLVHRTLSAWASRTGHLSADASIDSQRNAQDALATFREVKVLDRQTPILERFLYTRQRFAASMSDTLFLGQVPKYVFELGLVVGGLALTAALVARQGLAQSLVTLTVFLAAATRVTPSILRLQGAALALRVSRGQAEPTFQLISELAHQQIEHASSATWVAPTEETTGYIGFEARVEVNDVTFSYPGQPIPALSGVTLTLFPGQSLAIAGASGAGKSTLADVVLGLIHPDEGTIRISGRYPHEAIQTWPGAIAYVPQAVFVVEGTVRQNVALGIPASQIDDNLVWRALERARLDDFLRSCRDGLDTPVGERGTQLSGGQRQRLGIARALYASPRLLVLDEATSALDAETEASIASTLESLHGEVTTLIIAHRLGTLKSADNVIYLQEGSVVAQGSFDEVRLTSPAFAHQADLLGL